MARGQRSERRVFSPGEVSEIISTATRLQHMTDHGNSFGDVTIDQLSEIAGELAINEEVLARAVRSGDHDAKLERKTLRRRARWFRHVAVYAIGIGGLALMDLVSGGGLSWFLYPAIVWGVGLGIHARIGVSTPIAPARVVRRSSSPHIAAAIAPSVEVSSRRAVT